VEEATAEEETDEALAVVVATELEEELEAEALADEEELALELVAEDLAAEDEELAATGVLQIPRIPNSQ